jgi:hypothetical protein
MKIVILSFFILTNCFAIDFDMIPDKFNPKNIKVKFELSQSVNGAIGTIIYYQVGSNLATDKIIQYYENYLNSKWTVCESKVTKHNKWLLDYKNNKYELKNTIMAINKDRKLSVGFKIAQNIKTNKINIFIVQYYYNDDKQFNRGHKAMCKK